VVINLCDVAIPHPKQFERILEIVPHAEDKREKSREKYRSYRNHGITPRTHEISA
jgi:DNA polymerase IIIc chi subunit